MIRRFPCVPLFFMLCVGFDPLNLSGFIDIKWLREGELKSTFCELVRRE